MAITFVGSASVTALANAADQTISLTALTGGTRSSVAQDDFVIATSSVASVVDATLGIEDPSAVAYTLIGSELYRDSTHDTNLRTTYKFMSATPDASVTFKTTSGGSGSGWACNVYVFSGVDRTTPLDGVTPTTSSAASMLADPPAITPATTGAAVVAVGASAHTRSGSGGLFGSGDLTNFVTATYNTSSDISSGIGHIPNWSSGAVNPAGWSLAGGTSSLFSYAAITFALRPSTGIGRIKAWSGSAWVPKPVLFWTGTAWVTKPIKYWNGTAWITPPY